LIFDKDATTMQWKKRIIFKTIFKTNDAGTARYSDTKE
jgi:hypothetical protein